METVSLSVRKRDKAGTRASEALRKTGFIPAILYGHGEENISLALPMDELEVHLRHNVRILKLEYGDGSDQAMIKELHWDSLGDYLLHVDLLRVRMDEVVSMSVLLESKGRAKGIEEGGLLEVQRTDIHVKCLPGNIPDVIIYDVTELDLNESLHVKDITLPEGVELDDDPDQVVVSVTARVEVAEEAEAPAEGEEAEAPEGEKEGGGEEQQDKKTD